MEPRAITNDYDEATLRKIFRMDILEAGWHEGNKDYAMALGHAGGLCEFCGTPIIIAVNMRMFCETPYNRDPNIYGIYCVAPNIEVACPICHETTFIQGWRDPAITPILAELNVRDLVTYMSCQGHIKPTYQYSDQVSKEEYELLIKNRHNGDDSMWISFKDVKGIIKICQQYPLPEGIELKGYGSIHPIKEDDEFAFIKAKLKGHDPVELRMALYRWACSLPVPEGYEPTVRCTE